MTDRVAQIVNLLGKCLENPSEMAAYTRFAFPELEDFCSVLCLIIPRDFQIPYSLKLYGAMNLQQVIKLHWSDAHAEEFSEETKARLRSRILSLLDQQCEKSILNLIVMTIAVAFETDYPKTRPNAVDHLLEAVFKSQELNQCSDQYLIALYQCIRMVVQVKEGEDEENKIYMKKLCCLRQESKRIFSAIGSPWIKMSHQLLTSNSRNLSTTPDQSNLLARWCLSCLKVIQVLVVSFAPELNQDQVHQCIQTAIEYLGLNSSLLAGTSSQNNGWGDTLQQYSYKLSKFLIACQFQYPLSFARHLQDCLKIHADCLSNWRVDQHLMPRAEKIILSCMDFLSNVLKTKAYTYEYEHDFLCGYAHPPHRKEVEEVPDIDSARSAQQVVDQFFSDQLSIELFHWLLQRLASMTRRSFFDSEQELLATVAGNADSELDSLVCTSAKFLMFHLLKRKKDLICDEFTRTMSTVFQRCRQPGAVPDNIALKEACYSLLILGYLIFSDLLDFSDILQQFVSADICVQDPAYRPIKLRIATLFSTWIPSISPKLHDPIIQALCTLISDQDPAVQIAALISVNDVLEYLDLRPHVHDHYVRMLVEHVISLLSRSPRPCLPRILDRFSVTVRLLSTNILPHSQTILAYAQKLWEDTLHFPSHDSIKPSIITLLASLAELDFSLRPTLLPLVYISINSNMSCDPILVEQGLLLWWNILQTSDTITQDLVSFLPRLDQLVSTHSDDPSIARSTARILDCYVVLGGQDFLRTHVEKISALLSSILSSSPVSMHNRSLEGIASALDLIITLILFSSPETIPPLYPCLLQVAHILINLRITNALGAKACTVFQHLLSNHPDHYANFFQHLAQIPTTNNSEHLSSNLMIEQYLKHCRRIFFVESEKVWAWGLISLLHLPVLPPYVDRVLDAIAQLILRIDAQCSSARARQSETREYSEIAGIKGSVVDILKRQRLERTVAYYPLHAIKTRLAQTLTQLQSLSNFEKYINSVAHHTKQLLVQLGLPAT